jgi:hypothetical protein
MRTVEETMASNTRIPKAELTGIDGAIQAHNNTRSASSPRASRRHVT